MIKWFESERNRKKFFFIALIGCFMTILVYNFLTPVLSDDLSYATEVRKAASVADLFRQEYQQYTHWTGRSVAHIILRFFLYSGSKTIFNFVSSIMFTLLTFLMYLNVERRKKYDVKLYVFIVAAVWIFGVEFAQTILWETGACNYLFGAVFILSFMTLYKYYLNKGGNSILRCIGMLFLGIIAGWCNENTSGACVFYVLVLLLMKAVVAGKTQAADKTLKVDGGQAADYRKFRLSILFIHPWMIFGLIGNIIGLAMLVLAPGNAVRSSLRDDCELSVAELAARFLSITADQKKYFFYLLCALIVVAFVLIYQKAAGRNNGVGADNLEPLDAPVKQAQEVAKIEASGISFNMAIFFVLYFITAYVIVFAPDPQGRVFFGAGLFLIISLAQGLTDIKLNEATLYASVNGLVVVMLLYMAFSYISGGADLAWIKREVNERYDYIQEQAAAGEVEITVPQLRPQFKTKYSIAYESDVSENNEFWTNGAIAGYYAVDWIYGVPRDEWTAY